jgi:hypothetical protein
LVGVIALVRSELQTWKNILPFWAPEFEDQNPSAELLLKTSFKEGILNI